MSAERFQRGQHLPAFEGEAQAFPDEERAGNRTALAIAIAEASTAAAQFLADHSFDSPMTFEVSRINVVVAPNPGPKTYRVIITPGG